MEILVVDDNPIIRHTLVLQLDKLGFKADTAANGIEALRRLRKQRYALVLMDLEMPDMNGYEATAAIRQNEKAQALEPLPILAHSSAPDPVRCKEVGMDECIQKPLSLDQLRMTLSKYLPNRSGTYNNNKAEDGLS